MNDQLKYGIGGLVIGGVAIWFLTASAINSGNTGMMQMMGVPTAAQNMTRNSQSIDTHFIEQMIPHHEDAITIAKLAQTKANRDEVKQLSQNIIDSQGKEINQMKVWYKEWFGKDVPKDALVMGQHGMMQESGMHMGMMGNALDIAALEQSDDFDRAFVEHMIPHHQMAVMMASMLSQGTTRPEMNELAQNIIAAQTKEINQMRQWYESWVY